MSQTLPEDAAAKPGTRRQMNKAQPFDTDEGNFARDLYATSTTYIQLMDKSLSPNKPMHVFYTHFLQSLKYLETDDVPLAAMAFLPSSPTGMLLINPRNAKNLDIRSYAGLVVHELMHLIYGHLHTDELKRWPKLSNIAMDMAINQLVLKDMYLLPEGKGILTDNPHIPVSPCLPDSVAKQLQVDSPPKDESWQFYLAWLIKVVEALEKQGGTQKCQTCNGSGKDPDSKGGKSQGGQQPGGQQGSQPGGNQPGQGQGGQGQHQHGQGGSGGQDPGGQGDNDQQPGQQGGQGQQQGEHQHGPNGSPCNCPDPHGQDPNQQGKGQPGQGQGTPDDSCPDCGGQGERSVQDLIDELNGNTGHELWEEATEMSAEEAEIVKRFVAQTAQEAARSSGGESNLPGSIQGAYQNLVKCLEPQVDWTAHVREFAGNCGRLTPYVRKNRLNKHGFPGLLSFKPGGAVGCVLDTSGSVSDEEYGVFLAELLALARDYDLEVFVQETSYGITASTWKLSDEGIAEFYKRTGYGGTNMRPGIDVFLEAIDDKDQDMQVGGVIVFTDGELGHDSAISPEEMACYSIPLLWVFSRKTSNPFTGIRCAGEVIYFEKEINRRF